MSPPSQSSTHCPNVSNENEAPSIIVDSSSSSLSLHNEDPEKSYKPFYTYPQLEREGFAEIIQEIRKLTILLASLSLDVYEELEKLKSKRKESFHNQFEQSINFLGQIESSILEQSRNRDVLFMSTLSETPISCFSPVNIAEMENNKLTNKTDKLLARLKEATELPSVPLTGRPSGHPLDISRADENKGNSWGEDIERRCMTQIVLMVLNLERAIRRETKVNELPIQLAAATSQRMDGISSPRINRFASETAILLKESKLKKRWLEGMHKGSWFFRISRKFGPLGRALKTLQRRRVFIRLSPDFRYLMISDAEPKQQDDADGESKSHKTTTIALDGVVSFEYGFGSRAYRLLEETRSDTEHPAYLCVSFNTSKNMLDLIALNDTDIERWVLGLNCLIPFFPGRQFFTAVEFAEKKMALRQEFLKKIQDNNSQQHRQRNHSQNGEKEIS